MCLYAESSFPVPVFIWSKDSEVIDASPVLAGHTIRGSDFREKYLKKLFHSPQIIGVFLQDRLSIDDISHYGDAYSAGNQGAAFSNLKIAMETANSSAVLPSVEISSSSGKYDELIQLIREMANGLVKEFNPEESRKFDISEFSPDPEKTNVFIFHLLPTSHSEPAEIFAQNDKLIGTITQQMSSSGLSYSCILTAVSANEAIHERHLAEKRSQELAHDRFRRAVEKAYNSPAEFDGSLINGSLFIDAGCILVYFKGLKLNLKTLNTTYDVFNNASDLSFKAVPDCQQNTTDSVKISFGGLQNITKLDLSFSFTTNASNGEWKCTDVSLDIVGKNDINGRFSYNCSDILTAPTIYSYSCINVKLTSSDSSISFKSFQVQPFNVKNGTFAYGYDCTGFFTIPIFMGLISSGVLLIILFIAVLVMFSLTTMDRFDDPKGPTIHVPTG